MARKDISTFQAILRSQILMNDNVQYFDVLFQVSGASAGAIAAAALLADAPLG